MGKPKSLAKVEHVPGPQKKTRQGQKNVAFLKAPSNFLAVKAANQKLTMLGF
jgi:hypothetical protein